MNLQIFSDFFGQGKVLFWAFLVREVDFSNVFNCLGLIKQEFNHYWKLQICFMLRQQSSDSTHHLTFISVFKKCYSRKISRQGVLRQLIVGNFLNVFTLTTIGNFETFHLGTSKYRIYQNNYMFMKHYCNNSFTKMTLT